jgi:hypothetical protein
MKCKCGCDEEANFGEWKRGHWMRGKRTKPYKRKPLSEETKRKIGAKNSVKMKQYLAANPDAVRKQLVSMASGRTEESEARRVETLRSTYANMTEAEKQRFSDHSKRLWSENRDLMMAGVEKATATQIANYEIYKANGGRGSAQWRDKISLSMCELYLEGGPQFAHGRYEDLPTKSTKPSPYYRSSWELRRFKELDADPDVVWWTAEPFWIDYWFEGESHRYLPDLLVCRADNTCIEEVGVQHLKESQSRLIAKGEAAETFAAGRGWTYSIVSY